MNQHDLYYLAALIVFLDICSLTSRPVGGAGNGAMFLGSSREIFEHVQHSFLGYPYAFDKDILQSFLNNNNSVTGLCYAM